MEFSMLFQVAIAAILINNFILSRFLGLCPFFGVSKKLSNAVGMGVAVVFVMVFASLFTWTINAYVLVPKGVSYLQTIVFILVIASLVQLVEMVLQKYSPALYEALGIYLPLITTNCAILGVAVINTGENPFSGKPWGLVDSLVNAGASGLGFLLALVLMAGIRERLELAKTPKAFEGFPVAFVAAGLMALAFLGFSGLSLGR